MIVFILCYNSAWRFCQISEFYWSLIISAVSDIMSLWSLRSPCGLQEPQIKKKRLYFFGHVTTTVKLISAMLLILKWILKSEWNEIAEVENSVVPPVVIINWEVLMQCDIFIVTQLFFSSAIQTLIHNSLPWLWSLFVVWRIAESSFFIWTSLLLFSK